MNSGRVVVGRRAMGPIPVLRHVGVQTLLLPRGRGRRRHRRARGRTRVSSGARPQKPLFRRRKNTVAVVDRVTVRLDFQTLGGRESRRRRKGLEVGEGPEGPRAERQPRVQELRLQVIEDVRRQPAVGLHVPQPEAGSEGPVQLLGRLRHSELQHKGPVNRGRNLRFQISGTTIITTMTVIISCIADKAGGLDKIFVIPPPEATPVATAVQVQDLVCDHGWSKFGRFFPNLVHDSSSSNDRDKCISIRVSREVNSRESKDVEKS